MSLVDVDSWVTEFEACERLSHAILSQIAQRDNEQKFSSDYSRISGGIRIRMKQFETELGELKRKLEVSSRSGSITVEEIERRQRQVETLQSKWLQLQNRFKHTTRSDRDALLPPAGSSLWEGEDDDPIISPTSNNAEDLRQQQIRIMEEQNQGLEALSKSISRQKQLASRLGQEVEEQNDILDELATNMERVETRVTVQTTNVGSINRQDSTWGYWLVIMALFVGIVVVALL